MKKLAGFVIILAVLVLGGYYGMGFLTERTIKSNLQMLNQTNGLVADVQQYHRGLFSSDALIKWRLHIPERIVTDDNGNSKTIAAQDYQLETPIYIHHGPIIYSNDKMRFGMGYAKAQLPLPAEYNQQFNDLFSSASTRPQFDLSIFVSYFMHNDIEMALPTFKLITKDGTGTFDWMGMHSSLNMSSSRDQIDGDLVIDGLTFSKADAKVSLGRVSTEYNLHQTPAGLYLGDAKFNVPSFVVEAKNAVLLSIKELSMNSSSDIQDHLFRTNFNLGLQSVLANNKTYGPGALEISLRNLDADVLAQINQQANKIQNGTEEERQLAMIAIFPELPKLFSQGVELEISKLTFKIPEGSIDGNLLVSLPKGDNSNPAELIQKIQGHAKLKAPTALVKQLMQQAVAQQMARNPEMQQILIQQLQGNNTDPSQAPLTTDQITAMQTDKQIAAMEQNGLVVLSGSDYVIEMNFDQGKLMVNGKQFDSSMLNF